MSIPSAEEQLAFIQKIQRLFEEGDFSATYKFALLIALTDLAVERGNDEGEALEIPLDEIAIKFAELYWPLTVPYSSGAKAELLSQNPGKQAAIVNLLHDLRRSGADSLSNARNLASWGNALRRIVTTVRDMPVRYLQNLGGKLDPFLYDYPIRGDSVILNPGVGYLLRRFHGLISQLARSGWIRHVRQNSLNAPIIGQADDLESFMFGSAFRSNLSALEKILRPMQDGSCFYCGGRIREKGDVDHFIPWIKYPRDLAHNFVLAHAGCNRSKSDMLGAKLHLEKWLERNERYREEISGELGRVGFASNAESILTVANWAYRQGANAGAHAWLEKKVTG